MNTEELLVRLTARLAMLLYLVALCLRRSAKGRHTFKSWSQLMWTGGCFVYLLHVGCAFQFIHHWSHVEAYAATARTTAEVVGLDWGGGLYVNYCFTLVWLVDVAWWWLRPESYLARPRAVELVVQGFMGFIAFNATVVFAEGISRWMGVLGCMVLAVIWVRRG